MTLKLTKTVKTEVTTEIDLPAFFKDKSSYYAVFSEETIIQLDDFKTLNYIGIGQIDAGVLPHCEKITFREFEKAYKSVAIRAHNFLNEADKLIAPIAEMYDDSARDYAGSKEV